MEFFDNLNTLFIDNKEVESLYINGKQVWPLTDPTPQKIVQFLAGVNGQTVTVNFKGEQVGDTLQYAIKNDDGTFVVNRPYSQNRYLSNKSNLVAIHDICNTMSAVGQYSCYDCQNLTDVSINGVLSIAPNAFERTTKLTNVSMSGILSIDEDAFSCSDYSDSPYLKELSLYNVQYLNAPVKNRIELTSMNVAEDNDRFYFINGNDDTTKSKKGAILIDDVDKKVIWCSVQHVSSATLDDDVTTVGKNAFYSNVDLHTLNTSNLSSIEDYGFNNCLLLSSIGNTESIEKLGKGSFQWCTSLKDFKSDKVTEIPDYAFAYTSYGLSSLDTPNVSSVGKYGLNNARNLTSINFIPQKLGENAFSYCTNLTGVVLSAVKDIPPFCFDNCQKLTVSLSNVETIGNEAFHNTPITVANMDNVISLSGWVFWDCINLVSVYAPNLKEITDTAFRWCESLKSVDFPELTSVGELAFEGDFTYHDANIYNIKCPKLKYIGNSAFTYSKISSLYIPECLSIGNNAFSSCGSLLSIYCPNVEIIGSTPFSQCTKLVSVIIGEDNQFYCNVDSMLLTKDKQNLVWCSTAKTGDIQLPTETISVLPYALQNSKITTMYGQHIKDVGAYAFSYSKNLTAVSFPELSNLEGCAFDDCSNLKLINLSGVKKLGFNNNDDHFYNCTSLISADFPYLSNLSYGMFRGCKSLQFVNAPNATDFSYYVFENCEKLSAVNISNITNCGQQAFSNCKSLTSLNIPYVTSFDSYGIFENCIKLKEISCQSLSNFRSTAFVNCSSLTSIYIGEDNDVFYSYDNQLILNSDRDTIVYCAPGISCINNIYDTITNISSQAFYDSNIVSAELNNITCIGNGAFTQSEKLTNVELNNITDISEDAFSYCKKLTDIELNNITAINRYSFTGCYNLSSIKYNNILSIGEYAFQQCSNLLSINFNTIQKLERGGFLRCKNLISVEANDLTTIGDCAFQECSNLQSFKADNAVSVGNWTFDDCENILSIYLHNVLSLDTGTFCNCKNLTYIDVQNVKYINNAFVNCKKLTDLRLNKVEKFVAEWSSDFDGCDSLSNIYILTDAVPVLNNSVIFSRLPSNYTVYVKPEMLEQFSTASNWNSIYATGHISAYNQE